MNNAHRRHDISDELWNKAVYLAGKEGSWRRVVKDNNRCSNVDI